MNSDGDCSLREAVEAANSDSAVDACTAGTGADVINIPSGVYMLAAQLDVITDISFAGAGAATTRIDGGDATRVFQLGTKGDINVSMSGLAVQNGAASFGAGIRTFFGATLSLDHVAVQGNVAQCDGGGINAEAPLTVTHSAITNNESQCTDSGGGIIAGDELSLTNVTLSGNIADNGGALRIDGDATLLNVTIYDNQAQIAFGGILNNGTATITNTIVAASTGGNCGGNGLFTSGGHNVEDENTCGFGALTDQVNTDPGVGVLQNNGGATQTHALLDGSAAIDTADDAACPSDDQRDEPRPADGDLDGSAACDVGAYELQAAPLPSPTTAVGPTGVGPTVVLLPTTGDGSAGDGGASPWLIVALVAGAGAIGVYGVLRFRSRA
jgi:hypothetical protein